jgi:hypothetical protein
VLPGVSLTATTPQSSTQFTAVSDSQGFYRLMNLPPGTYDVVAALQGFSRFERKGLTNLQPCIEANPQWARDGREIYFLKNSPTEPSNLLVASVASAAAHAR